MARFSTFPALRASTFDLGEIQDRAAQRGALQSRNALAERQLGLGERRNALAERQFGLEERKFDQERANDERQMVIEKVARVGAAYLQAPDDMRAAQWPKMRQVTIGLGADPSTVPEQPGPEADQYVREQVARVLPLSSLKDLAFPEPSKTTTRRRALDTQTNQLAFVTDAQIEANPQRYQPIPSGTSIEQTPEGFRVITGELAAQRKRQEKPRTVQESATIASAESAAEDLKIVEEAFFDDDGTLNNTALIQAAVDMPGSKGRGGTQALRRSVEVILRARSGAAVPTAEVDLYMELYAPSIFDSVEQARRKLDALRTFFDRSLELLKGSGGSPVGIPADPGEFLREPEDAGQEAPTKRLRFDAEGNQIE